MTDFILSAVDIALLDLADEFGPVSIDIMVRHTCCSAEELLPHLNRLVARKILEVTENGEYYGKIVPSL